MYKTYTPKAKRSLDIAHRIFDACQRYVGTVKYNTPYRKFALKAVMFEANGAPVHESIVAFTLKELAKKGVITLVDNKNWRRPDPAPVKIVPPKPAALPTNPLGPMSPDEIAHQLKSLCQVMTQLAIDQSKTTLAIRHLSDDLQIVKSKVLS